MRKCSSALKRHKQLIHATRDFSDGQAVKNPPSNARDVGSVSGRGARIPLAVGPLSPCATAAEPECSRPKCHSWRSPVAATKTHTAKKYISFV